MGIKKGDKVKVEYICRLEDNRIIDKTQDNDPVEFTVGGDNVIKGFSSSVVGMKLNDEKTITLKAEEAYGLRRKELIKAIPRMTVPKDAIPEKGARISVDIGEEKTTATVIDITDKLIVLDANHPLAGIDLTFDLKVVDIEKK